MYADIFKLSWSLTRREPHFTFFRLVKSFKVIIRDQKSENRMCWHTVF